MYYIYFIFTIRFTLSNKGILTRYNLEVIKKLNFNLDGKFFHTKPLTIEKTHNFVLLEYCGYSGIFGNLQGGICFHLYIVTSSRFLFKRFSFENK